MEIVNKPQVIGKPKAEKTEQKVTTLDKGVEFVKEHTKKGTLVGDHYIAVTAGTLVGGTAAGTLIAKSPVLRNAFDKVFVENGNLWLGGMGVGASAVLAEDAVASFQEGSTFKGSAEAVGAAVTGLGGAEALAKQFNINARPLTATARFIGDNAMAITGATAVAGGAFAAKEAVASFSEDKKLKGSALAAGGTVAILGGGELIGRQFDIPVLKEALSGPAKAIFKSNGGKVAVGAAVGLTGAGTGVDGVRRLTQDKGLVNDAIGVAEVTAATTAVAGGASLVGMGIGSEKLTSALANSPQIIGGVAALGSAVALGKMTVKDASKNGVTLLNTATGTAAALAALGGTQLVAEKLAIPVLDKSFKGGWETVTAVGLGAASYKFGSNAIREGKEGNMLNAAGQAGLSLVTGAASAGIIGNKYNIPVLDKIGEKGLEVAGHIVEPIFEFATQHPALTLGAVTVAAGVGIYAYTRKEKEEEAPKAEK